MNLEVKGAENRFVVRTPKIAYGVGILIIGIGLVLLVLELLFHVGKIPVWIYLVILAICLFGWILCTEARNRRLEVAGDKLYYINILKQKFCFGMQDIGYVKAAANPVRGRDYMYVYDKEGKKLCKLECSMHNARRFISYLHDSGITIELEKDAEKSLTDIVLQQAVEEGDRKELAGKVYEEAEDLIKNWQSQNRKTGASFYYGFAQYHGNKIKQDAEIQSSESRYEIQEDRDLAEDYLCVMEIYVKKEEYFIRDKKGKLLLMAFPVFYKRKAASEDGVYRLYYNGSFITELEDALDVLERYLPGHKFIQERMNLGYELKKDL